MDKPTIYRKPMGENLFADSFQIDCLLSWVQTLSVINQQQGNQVPVPVNT